MITSAKLKLPHYTLSLDKSCIVGIVNITPDSFSDGGQYLAVDAAVAQALTFAKQGADMIDLGAESTRPGAQAVDATTQLARLLPVIEALDGRLPIPISVDTGDAVVIETLAKTSVAMINDVYALRKPNALAAFLKTDMAICLVHMQNTPLTMQQKPYYQDVVQEVQQFLIQRAAILRSAGVVSDRIALDPGFGFGKRIQDNYQLLKHLSRLALDPYPLYVGVSRKSMFQAVTGDCHPKARNFASLAAEMYAVQQGARFIRTHDVIALRHALDTLNCIDTCDS